ncbi:hypothetical protein T484DRAFT_3633880, partial [Baffinella frigidus]
GEQRDPTAAAEAAAAAAAAAAGGQGNRRPAFAMWYTAEQLVEMYIQGVVDVLTAPDEPTFAAAWGVLAWAGAWAVMISFCAAAWMVFAWAVATSALLLRNRLARMHHFCDVLTLLCVTVATLATLTLYTGGFLVTRTTAQQLVGMSTAPNPLATAAAWGGSLAAFIVVAIEVVIVVASSYLVVFIVVARLAAGETTRDQLVEAIVQILPLVTVAVMFACFGYGGVGRGVGRRPLASWESYVNSFENDKLVNHQRCLLITKGTCAKTEVEMQEQWRANTKQMLVEGAHKAKRARCENTRTVIISFSGGVGTLVVALLATGEGGNRYPNGKEQLRSPFFVLLVVYAACVVVVYVIPGQDVMELIWCSSLQRRLRRG